MSDQFGNIPISEGPTHKQEPASSTRPRKPVKKKLKKKIPPKPKPQKERKEINWGRFSLILTFIITTLLVIYAGIGFFLVPKLLQTNLIEEIKISTDLEVEMNRVTFNPFPFEPNFKIFPLKITGTRQTSFPFCRLIILTSTLNSLHSLEVVWSAVI